MAYQTSVPNTAQSPGLFPTQGADNFTRLKTIIGANHKFNDSAATDDGYHQIIKSLPVAAGSVPNDATVGQSFVNSADATNQLWHKDALNRLFQVTPTIPTYAAVNFTYNGSAVTINFNFNIQSVTRDSQGLYTIRFTTAMPSANYIVTGTAMGASLPLTVSVAPNATYGNSVTTALVKIEIANTSAVDPLAAFIMICGG
jgi:hypothetical protein